MSRGRMSGWDLVGGSGEMWTDVYHMTGKGVWFCFSRWASISDFFTNQLRPRGKSAIIYLPEFHRSCRTALPLADPTDHHLWSGKHLQKSQAKRKPLRTRRVIFSSSSAEASCIQGREVVTADLHFSLSPKLAGHWTTLESGRHNHEKKHE